MTVDCVDTALSCDLKIVLLVPVVVCGQMPCRNKLLLGGLFTGEQVYVELSESHLRIGSNMEGKLGHQVLVLHFRTKVRELVCT